MTAKSKSGSSLGDIKKRLRAGEIRKADLKRLEKWVMAAEKSLKSLRAAVVE